MAQTITVLGIDIATQVFHSVGRDDRGRVVLRKRLARRTWPGGSEGRNFGQVGIP